jgi:hypothetical protein
MPATEKVSYALTPETVRQIEELSKLCGGIRPAPKSHIIVEAVRLMYEAKTGATRRRNGKGEK